MLSARSGSSTSPPQPNSATQPPSSGTLSPSPYGFQNSQSQDSNASLLSRLQLCVEIIEKEYTQFNTKNATRKQKKIIPRLFYSFYPSSLCTNFIVACFEYLEDFLRNPMKDGESLNLNGPGTHRGDGRESKVKVSDKVLLLQERLQRVAECWSAILLYRAEMNRHETITVSNTMKRSEHFLNDTFDAYFFEALYLLVEYVIEFQFLDQSRAQLETKNAPIVSTTTPVANASPSVITSSPNPNSSPTAGKATSKSATATAAEIERNWRLVQHELQRILRTRNFHYSQKAHARERASNVNKGNGLNHAPLGNALAGVAASGTRRHKTSGKNSLSYRDPMTFRLNGPRKWNEDPIDAAELEDNRALSHLPGHFRTKGGLGVNECLDLRSPLIACVLPNPRTMAATNDKYVFGMEEKRNAGKRRFGGRLTHAEEKYLTEQHAKQEKREMEVKLRMEREAREEAEREEAEERRRLEEEDRMHEPLEGEGEQTSFRVEVQEESKEQIPENITLTLPFNSGTASANSTSTSMPPLVPSLKLPASNSSTLRPTPPLSVIHSVIQSSANSPHTTRPPSATASTAALNSSRSIRTAVSLTARPPPARPQRSAASARLVRLDPNLAVQVAQLDRQPHYVGRAPSLDEKLKSFVPIIAIDRTSNRISFRDLRF